MSKPAALARDRISFLDRGQGLLHAFAAGSATSGDLRLLGCKLSTLHQGPISKHVLRIHYTRIVSEGSY